MYTADSLTGEIPVVAVIGGGASGTLVAAHIVREAGTRRLPLSVALIDRHGRHARGQAYSTIHPEHLLNSPADTMSAFGDDPGHLLRWANERKITYDGFLPRSSYGDYLTEILVDTERRAAPEARVSRISSHVVGIRQDCGHRALRLDLAAEGRIDADVAVLATGSPPPATPFPIAAGRRYIADPWEPGALERTGDGGLVVILGSGPTMIDVAILMAGQHPATRIVAVSRHGLLPQAYSWPRRTPGVPSDPVVSRRPGPLRLRRLIREVRISAAEQSGHWQDVVEALRTQIPSLWRQLPDFDKQLFLRHVARYWEVHRHRMPPSTARQVGLLQTTGRLTVLSGRIVSGHDAADSIRVKVDLGASQAELNADWLINCAGPATDISATGDPLLRSLFDSGLARPDPLGLGLDTDTSGSVRRSDGTIAGNLYALGPLLRGLWYETTAIPEIRAQAASLARLLAARMDQIGPRNAA
jgi:uncharacterized NAD(P)/FAD-binding protein YdhS